MKFFVAPSPAKHVRFSRCNYSLEFETGTHARRAIQPAVTWHAKSRPWKAALETTQDRMRFATSIAPVIDEAYEQAKPEGIQLRRIQRRALVGPEIEKAAETSCRFAANDFISQYALRLENIIEATIIENVSRAVSLKKVVMDETAAASLRAGVEDGIILHLNELDQISSSLFTARLEVPTSMLTRQGLKSLSACARGQVSQGPDWCLSVRGRDSGFCDRTAKAVGVCSKPPPHQFSREETDDARAAENGRLRTLAAQRFGCGVPGFVGTDTRGAFDAPFSSAKAQGKSSV